MGKISVIIEIMPYLEDFSLICPHICVRSLVVLCHVIDSLNFRENH